MVPAVNSVSEGVSSPGVANCHGFRNEWAPDLEFTFIFLLTASIVLSLDDEFGSGRNEVAILSCDGESIKGASIVNPDHAIKGEDDMVVAELGVLENCGIPWRSEVWTFIRVWVSGPATLKGGLVQ